MLGAMPGTTRQPGTWPTPAATTAATWPWAIRPTLTALEARTPPWAQIQERPEITRRPSAQVHPLLLLTPPPSETEPPRSGPTSKYLAPPPTPIHCLASRRRRVTRHRAEPRRW